MTEILHECPLCQAQVTLLPKGIACDGCLLILERAANQDDASLIKEWNTRAELARSVKLVPSADSVLVPRERLERWEVMFASAGLVGIDALYDDGKITPNGQLCRDESKAMLSLLAASK